MMITKNADPDASPYLKMEMTKVYYIENPILKEIYVKSGAISSNSFVDIELYKKYINLNYRDEFLKFREFFQKTPDIKGWFRYYYFYWRKIELVETDLFTILKEKKWILIENKMYKCSEISLKMLMEEGYFKGELERSINVLCDVLQISLGEVSTTAQSVISSLNQLSSSELIYIQSKLEERITNNHI
ncbi:MAG: hypothetical protein ACERKN_16715 [Velocimicrobium sp.]